MASPDSFVITLINRRQRKRIYFSRMSNGGVPELFSLLAIALDHERHESHLPATESIRLARIEDASKSTLTELTAFCAVEGGEKTIESLASHTCYYLAPVRNNFTCREKKNH